MTYCRRKYDFMPEELWVIAGENMSYCRSNLSNILTTDMERVGLGNPCHILRPHFYICEMTHEHISTFLWLWVHGSTSSVSSCFVPRLQSKFRVTLTLWIIAWQLDVMGSNLESAFGPPQMEFWSFCWHTNMFESWWRAQFWERERM